MKARKELYVRLVMLGTGHALVTRCYNACFLLEDDATSETERGAGVERGAGAFDSAVGGAGVERGAADAGAGAGGACGAGSPCFLVDAGGGNGVMTQLERAGVDWRRVSDLFITHTHIDHVLGAVWMLRLVCHHLNEGDYESGFTIWGNDQVIAALEELAHLLLRPQETRFLGNGVRLRAVSDGEAHVILGRKTTFFDIRSAGAKQFGFAMEMERLADHRPRTFVCCGDEPMNEANRAYVEGAEWLVHEAFCLDSEVARYNPHPINHGTVVEACATAQRLGVRNLVLYHTEDDDLLHRKERYTAEGRRCFSGNLYVPDDLEAFEL